MAAAATNAFSAKSTASDLWELRNNTPLNNSPALLEHFMVGHMLNTPEHGKDQRLLHQTLERPSAQQCVLKSTAWKLIASKLVQKNSSTREMELTPLYSAYIHMEKTHLQWKQVDESSHHLASTPLYEAQKDLIEGMGLTSLKEKLVTDAIEPCNR